MPAQDLITPDMITAETLRIAANTMAMGNLVDRQWDDSFARPDMKIGSTVEIRLPNRYLVSSGQALVAQPIQEQKVPLTISEQLQVGMSFTQSELTLDIDRFSERYINPAASQLAATIDHKLAQQYINIANSTGTPGTAPATALALMEPMALLTENACPLEGRNMVLTPRGSIALVNGFDAKFNPTDIISTQFRTGAVASKIFGYENIMVSQSVASHLCGTRTATGASTVSATMTTQGSTTITISGTTGQTIKKGDVFTIAGVFNVNPQTRESTGQLKQFVVTEDITAAASAYTNLKFAPAIYTPSEVLASVNSFPQASAAVVFVGTANTSYKQYLVFHRSAIAAVSPRLPIPQGVQMASALTVDGLSATFVGQFDINAYQTPYRLDSLYGAATLRREWGCRVWGEVG